MLCLVSLYVCAFVYAVFLFAYINHFRYKPFFVVGLYVQNCCFFELEVRKFTRAVGFVLVVKFCSSFWCSLILCLRYPNIWPIYVLLHLLQGILYTTFDLTLVGSFALSFWKKFTLNSVLALLSDPSFHSSE